MAMNAANPRIATSAAIISGMPVPGVPALTHPAASTNAVTVTPSTSAPAMSNLRPERPAMWGTATTASARAIMPTGMLIQKIQRQPQASVMRPPAIGPTRIAMGNAAPIHDMTRGRSRGDRDLADDRLRHEVETG